MTMEDLRKQIDLKIQKLDRNNYPHTMLCGKIQDKETIPILETIFSILNSFDERLKKLEST